MLGSKYDQEVHEYVYCAGGRRSRSRSASVSIFLYSFSKGDSLLTLKSVHAFQQIVN